MPATTAGLPPSGTLAAGISVNVTLIFSIDRYREVMDAHTAGYNARNMAWMCQQSIGRIVFCQPCGYRRGCSAEDSSSPRAESLRGRAAIANAHLAWHAYEIHTASDAWRQLAAAGARPQRRCGPVPA